MLSIFIGHQFIFFGEMSILLLIFKFSFIVVIAELEFLIYSG
jgi:hypothetical protein